MIENKNKLGFTLIEMMMVVTIMGILIMAGVAAYNDFNRKQRVRQAAQSLVTTLRAAQKNADRSELPAGCNVLEGYRVDDITSTTLRISAYCNNGGLVDVNSQTYTMSNDTQVGAITPFVFRVLSQGVSNSALTPLGADVVIDVSLLEGGVHTATVTLSRGGSLDADWP